MKNKDANIGINRDYFVNRFTWAMQILNLRLRKKILGDYYTVFDIYTYSYQRRSIEEGITTEPIILKHGVPLLLLKWS